MMKSGPNEGMNGEGVPRVTCGSSVGLTAAREVTMVLMFSV